eukprot:tig00021318_g20162.t1
MPSFLRRRNSGSGLHKPPDGLPQTGTSHSIYDSSYVAGGAGSVGGGRLILVTGATGHQGGSVVHHLLQQGQFRVRALTRRPDSPKARALASRGVEVVQGDFNDYESVVRACAGCYGVFAVTNFWEHGAQESVHGQRIAQAAQQCRVQHLVLSTLESVSQATRGRVTEARQFDGKAEVAELVRNMRIPATFIRPSFNYENFRSLFKPSMDTDGHTVVFRLPLGSKQLFMIAAEDIGGIVASVFAGGQQHIGLNVGVAGDRLSGAEIAAAFSRATGRPARFESISLDKFRQFRDGAEIAAMFDYYQNYAPERDPATSRRLYPALRGFEAWVRETGWTGPAPKLAAAESSSILSSFLGLFGTSPEKASPAPPPPPPRAAPTAMAHPPSAPSSNAVLVMGVTGNQGGAVASGLLAAGRWEVHGLTRRPADAKAQELARRGVRIVQGDLADSNSLVEAMRGKRAVFCVLPFMGDYALEVAHGRRAVAAARQAGVQHFILSGGDDVSGVSKGKISECSFMDAKAAVERELAASGIPFTVLRPGWYMENVATNSAPQPRGDGALVFRLPLKPAGRLPLFACADLGPIVAAILDAPFRWIGQSVDCTGEHLSMKHLVETFSRVTGRRAAYEEISKSQFRKIPTPLAVPLAAFYAYFEAYPERRDTRACRDVYPRVRTFEQWLMETGYKGPDQPGTAAGPPSANTPAAEPARRLSFGQGPPARAPDAYQTPPQAYQAAVPAQYLTPTPARPTAPPPRAAAVLRGAPAAPPRLAHAGLRPPTAAMPAPPGGVHGSYRPDDSSRSLYGSVRGGAGGPQISGRVWRDAGPASATAALFGDPLSGTRPNIASSVRPASPLPSYRPPAQGPPASPGPPPPPRWSHDASDSQPYGYYAPPELAPSPHTSWRPAGPAAPPAIGSAAGLPRASSGGAQTSSIYTSSYKAAGPAAGAGAPHGQGASIYTSSYGAPQGGSIYTTSYGAQPPGAGAPQGASIYTSSYGAAAAGGIHASSFAPQAPGRVSGRDSGVHAPGARGPVIWD